MTRNSAIILALVFAVCSAATFGDWRFYEETRLQGSISGTIKMGSVFKTQSGSIYEVSELTLQLVLELSPSVVVMQNGSAFKLIVDGFEEPLICRQLAPPARLPTRPPPRPEAKSLPRPAPDSKLPLSQLIPQDQQKEMGLQKLTDSERERLRQFLAELYLRGVEDGKKPMVSEASPPEVKAASPSVIESTIDGEFEGWSGETIVKLMNGQIWQQSAYHYEYHYAYMPKVMIYQSRGAYRMKVEGVQEAVEVTQLK